MLASCLGSLGEGLLTIANLFQLVSISVLASLGALRALVPGHTRLAVPEVLLCVNHKYLFLGAMVEKLKVAHAELIRFKAIPSRS